VELYARVRRAVVVDKMSEREAARQFGLARDTVRKMLRYSVPPGYRRQQPARRPKLDAWVGAIDQILEQDKAEGKKQRHTAKRIFERLRDEHAYTGGYTIVKDYVRLRKLSQREMFVPLAHPPGDAQTDFVVRDQEAGGSNPLAPTIYPSSFSRRSSTYNVRYVETDWFCGDHGPCLRELCGGSGHTDRCGTPGIARVWRAGVRAGRPVRNPQRALFRRNRP
jgi:transposase